MKLSVTRVSVLLLSLLCLSSETAASATKLLIFHSFNKCPTSAAAVSPRKMDDKLQCVVICSLQPRCNAFYFEKTTGQCFYGDACSELEQWTDGDCDSFKYTDDMCEHCESVNPLFGELKMKIFYKFSRSGLVNEVNPRQFCLKARNVIVNASGAHFEGHTNSYLTTETPVGFYKLLEYGAEFSGYVRAEHVFAYGYEFYHRFQECGSELAGNSFIKLDDLFYNAAALKQQSNEYLMYSTSPRVLPIDEQLHEISLGFAFNGTAHQNLFVNGSIVKVDIVSLISIPYFQGRFDCLHLGRAPIDASCLKGVMFCYGFSTKVLSPSDFQLIQQLCDEQ